MVDSCLPYAQALLSVAQDEQKEDAFLDDFARVKTVLKDNPELPGWLAHPAVHFADKEKLLVQIFKDDVQPSFLDFLKVVCRNQMCGHLNKIGSDYRELLDQSRNIQTVEVASAAELDEEQKKRLQHALEKRLGGSVRLKCSVDPSLIAGMKIRTKESILDASYQGQLAKMKEQLQKS